MFRSDTIMYIIILLVLFCSMTPKWTIASNETVATSTISSFERQRRQLSGECFTLEGIPGACNVPDSCRFPPAVKVRLFRSSCVTREGQRGICCPGGTATPAFQQQQQERFQQLRLQALTSARPIFRQNTNGPFLVSSPVDFSTPDNSVNDFTSLCTDESQNCLPQQGVVVRRPAQRTFRPSPSQPSSPLSRPIPLQFTEPVTPTFRPQQTLQQQRPQQQVLQQQQPQQQQQILQQQQQQEQELNQINQVPLVTNNNQQSSILQQQFQLDNTQQVPPQILEQISVTNPPLKGNCPETPVCFSSKYRTFDGSCNNLKNPNWGKSFFAFPRLMAPVYADGISTPRMASDGSELPSPRLVSSSLIADANVPDNFNTNMIMAFGQFLDHDLTRTAVNKGKNNTGIACCRREMIENPSLRHQECLPIKIPANDPFYAQFNQSCMEFVRSLSSPRPDCTFGAREQMNQITSFIDASNMYGSTKDESNDLRTFQAGRLQVSRVNDVDLLPFVTTKPDFCSKPDQGLFCFKAGDTRVNEQISLTIIHTVWLREHNRIARELGAINPTWTDENIFQETRRIVGAMFQHIVYNEFLPVLLGRRTMQSAQLLLLREGYTFDYDATINPGVTNEFATAAYRFGHTLIPGNFMMFGSQGQSEEVPLRDVFNKPFHLFKTGGMDSTLRGLCTQRSQQFDSFITQEVTQHLFQRTRPFGLDLVAINLQRGRDHGLPGYNQWRRFCGLSIFSTFDELRSEINPQFVQTLQQLYRSVDDIDVFVAGVAEKPLPGAKLGSTFACIVSEQFKRLKKGDRFWYENGFNSQFTPEQLQEIRKVTFARLICDNSDGIDQIQQFVFFAPARGNSLMPCQGTFIPRMNLALWTGEPV